MTQPITLVAIDTDPVSRPLTRYAVQRSLATPGIEEVLFFGGAPLGVGEQFIRIERFDSIDSYSEFVFKCLWPFIRTEFMMVVHWDGFVVNPGLWQTEFLAHDYIGAPWAFYPDDMKVGNGGFCIRSKKLMLASRDPRLRRFPEVPTGGAEDVVICRIHRRHFESQGLSFAPERLATKFSYETGPYPGPTYGFHSPHNMPLFLGDDALLELAPALKTKIRPGSVRDVFIANCKVLGRDRFLARFLG